MDAFLAALGTFLTEANALESNVNGKESNTNADAIATAADVVSTHADVVLTHADVIAAAASAASAVLSPGTNATSTTSLTIGTGDKSPTIQAGKYIVVGMGIKIARTSAPTNWMHGTCTAYNSGTGAMTVNVTVTQGSGGPFTDWTISLSGMPGTDGAAGAKGDKGDTGNTGAKGDTGALGKTSVTMSFYNPSGIPGAAMNRQAWCPPYACTVTGFKCRVIGGTDAVVNARRNGSSNHLASNHTVAPADNWHDLGAVQNTAYNGSTDYLEFMVVGTSGTVTEICFQLDFTVP
jgi:hypothetical protein